VTAWVSFRTQHPAVKPEATDEMRKGLERVLSELAVALPIVDGTVSEVRCGWSKPSSQVRRQLTARSGLALSWLFQPVAIQASVDVDVDALRRVNSTENLEHSLIEHCAGGQLANAIENALTLADLAEPSCVQTLHGFVAVNNRPVCEVSEKGMRPQIGFPEREQGDPFWPPLQELRLSDVVRWASHIGMFSRSLANSRIGRALAAFSYVVDLALRGEGEVLFRAMQGLEAFYSDGVGDLRRQLSQKVSLWLGQWSDEKNIVGQLYDLRSKFVHGSGSIEFASTRGNDWEDLKAMHEFDTATTFAVRLLIATLQKCVTTQAADIKWIFSAEVKPLSPQA
jgi:hypothetical protein